jgi:hypothetical protein
MCSAANDLKECADDKHPVFHNLHAHAFTGLLFIDTSTIIGDE